MRPFAIIVAYDSKYGIGKHGQLPWHLPSDLKHFKEITSTVVNPAKKNALIMGRKTWESIPPKFRPLPGRMNLVLSREGNLSLPSEVRCAQNLDDALNLLTTSGTENVFVIGGAQIYALALEHPLCQKLYVTHVQGDYGCDTFFPPVSKQFMPISASEEILDNDVKFHYSEYLRN